MFVAAEAGHVPPNLRQPVQPTQPAESLRAQRQHVARRAPRLEPKAGATPGTGAHALALQARAGDQLNLLCVDENEECLELARAKAVVVNQEAEFRRENLSALSFHDDEFDLVLGNGSMVAPPQLPKMIGEMVRVSRPGAGVAWWLATASSFGEFFTIYWEALLGAGLDDHGAEVEKLIVERPTVRDAEEWAEHAGLDGITSWTNIEEFDFESGEQFFNSPLITDFLLPTWIQSVPKASRKN